MPVILSGWTVVVLLSRIAAAQSPVPFELPAWRVSNIIETAPQVSAERGAPADFPRADPVSEGVDAGAMARLAERAQAEHSDSVLLLKDGKLIYSAGDWDQRMFAMSATKSVAGLAVGALIEDGRISSLDQKVSDFLTEWKEGEKNKITVRMLLNHTSGLDTNGRGAYFALDARVVYPPGTGFAYNNPAVDLLALVIAKASGEKADRYLSRRIFEPLGIADVDWKYKDGLPLTAGELKIRPIDLAKIGQMVLDGGVYHGRRIIGKEWIDLSSEASQPYDMTCGLLWWRDAEVRMKVITPRLLEVWKSAGVRPELIAPLRSLLGRPMEPEKLRAAVKDAYAGRPEHFKEFYEILSKNRLQLSEPVELGRVEGFSAQGWLGQFLVIDPKRRLVGVRMRRSRATDYPSPTNPNPPYVDGFDDFPKYVHALTP